jgi:hypothetical protein
MSFRNQRENNHVRTNSGVSKLNPSLGYDFPLKKYKDDVLVKTCRPGYSSTAYLSPFPKGHPMNKDKVISKEDMLPTAQHKFIASHVFKRSLSIVKVIEKKEDSMSVKSEDR